VQPCHNPGLPHPDQPVCGADTETEQALAEIWAEGPRGRAALVFTTISLPGGDSIRGIPGSLAGRATRVEITLEQLFRLQTSNALAKEIGQTQTRKQRRCNRTIALAC